MKTIAKLICRRSVQFVPSILFCGGAIGLAALADNIDSSAQDGVLRTSPFQAGTITHHTRGESEGPPIFKPERNCV